MQSLRHARVGRISIRPIDHGLAEIIRPSPQRPQRGDFFRSFGLMRLQEFRRGNRFLFRSRVFFNFSGITAKSRGRLSAPPVIAKAVNLADFGSSPHARGHEWPQSRRFQSEIYSREAPRVGRCCSLVSQQEILQLGIHSAQRRRRGVRSRCLI